ncbi:MAG: hypothetical protein Q9209_007402 [Squamulea sp. 1 TL-2023]
MFLRLEQIQTNSLQGPIVRINPAELHVKDSDWLGALYTGPASGIRDKYPPAAHMTGTPNGTFGTVSHEVHRRRRAAIGPFFSKATVATSESMIYDKANILSQLLRKKMTTDGVVELRQTFLALTTDTLSHHAFDQPSNLLSNEQAAVDWMRTVKAIAYLTPLIKQFTWIIPLALKIPLTPLRAVVPDLARIVALRLDLYNQAEIAIRAATSPMPNKDLASFGAKPPNGYNNIFQSILSSKSLPPREKERNRITQEAFVVLVAGGETTARVLTTAAYHLVANRDTALSRLKEELATVFVKPETRVDVKDLEQLPWLASRTAISPIETLEYNGWQIPAGTPISMTLRDVLLDPSIFAEPMRFMPERWLSDNPDLHRINQYYVPFGRGSRMCIGLNFALAELYIIIARIFSQFELEIFDTIRERDVDYMRDCFIGETSPESLGVRMKVVKEANLVDQE